MRSAMAAHIARTARSRGFIKVYLVTWGLLAIGALAYLSLLALQPPSGAQRMQTAEPEAGPTLRAVSKTVADMGVAVRRGFSDVQKDITHLKEVLVDREAQDKAVQARLNVLEEKVATIDAAQAAAPAPSKMKPEKTPRKTADGRVTPHIINAPPPTDGVASVKHDAPLETGSITPAKEIVFGEAVVTPSSPTAYAVQLAASPSLDGLRQRWDQLLERHGASLATLQPRVVPPASGGGAYKLVAGPIQSRADGERVCAEMGVARNACFVTAYAGRPL
jgi:hypothetical protein